LGGGVHHVYGKLTLGAGWVEAEVTPLTEWLWASITTFHGLKLREIAAGTERASKHLYICT